MEISKEISKQKRFLFPLVAVLFVVLASLFILKPKIGQILEPRRTIAGQKQLLSKLTEKAAVLEGLDKNELNDKVDFSFKVVPVEKDVPLIMSLVKDFSQQAGLSLKTIKTDPGGISTESASKQISSGAEEVDSYPFTLVLEGGLPEAKSFLDLIKQTAPLIKVESFSMSNEQTETGKSGQISLAISTYFHPLPTELGPVESPVALLTQQEEKLYETLTKLTVPATQENFQEVPSGKANIFEY